jgi:hypothetical protein
MERAAVSEEKERKLQYLESRRAEAEALDAELVGRRCTRSDQTGAVWRSTRPTCTACPRPTGASSPTSSTARRERASGSSPPTRPRRARSGPVPPATATGLVARWNWARLLQRRQHATGWRCRDRRRASLLRRERFWSQDGYRLSSTCRRSPPAAIGLVAGWDFTRVCSRRRAVGDPRQRPRPASPGADRTACLEPPLVAERTRNPYITYAAPVGAVIRILDLVRGQSTVLPTAPLSSTTTSERCVMATLTHAKSLAPDHSRQPTGNQRRSLGEDRPRHHQPGVYSLGNGGALLYQLWVR